jgi:hypothetical protein
MLRPSSKDKLRGPRFWLPVFRTRMAAWGVQRTGVTRETAS